MVILVDITLEKIPRELPVTSKMTVKDEGLLGDMFTIQLSSQTISDEFLFLLFLDSLLYCWMGSLIFGGLRTNLDVQFEVRSSHSFSILIEHPRISYWACAVF